MEKQEFIETYNQHFKRSQYDKGFFEKSLQNVMTPLGLVFEILEKILESIDNIYDKQILVFNVEFAYVLIKWFKVPMTNITAWSDIKEKNEFYSFLGITKFISGGPSLKHIYNHMKFDVIIGNPPYQNESETTQDPLWPKFMNLSNRATKPGGYTALIVPKNWLNAPIFTTNNRKGSDLERTRMLNIVPYNMVYLAIDTPKKYFNVGSDFTYYVIHKVEHDETKTQVEYLDNGEIKRNEIQTNDYDKIPHNLNKNTLSIIDKVFNEKLEKLEGDVTANPLGFAGSGHLKKEPDSVYCFKNVSTSSHYKNGKFFYSKIEHPNANRKKIIFSVSGYANPFFDNGELGTCHHGRSILVKDEIEANKYIKYLNSKLVTFLSSVYPSSHLAVGLVKVVDKLPKIDTSIEMSDENIYNYFNLTQEEIDYIESNVK